MRLALVLLLLLAQPALGGPWVRPKGEAYVFAGHEDGKDGWSSIYAELGGGGDITWGLDIGGRAMGSLSDDADIPLEGRIRLFARVPLWSSEAARADRPAWLAPWLLAVEASAGLDRATNGDQADRYGLGLTIGRPLSTRFGDGWTTLDLRATVGGGKRRRLNAQYVVGVKPTERLTLELGLFAEDETDDSYALAPTVVYGLGQAGAARLGLSFKDGGDTIIRLGWTRSF